MQKLVFGFVLTAIFLAGYFSAFNGNTELQVSGDAVKPISNCQRLPPSVIVAPSTQTGAPGVPKYYYLTITNNNIGPSCGISQFNLFDINQYAQVGWTTSLFPTTLNLCSSNCINTSQNADYFITSPTTAQSGTYDFYVVAYETGQGAAGVVRADYVI